MARYPRYAIYFVPPAESALYRFGSTLLGYDAFTGDALPFAKGVETQIDGWRTLTAGPGKYGFHATLKAPITLAPDKSEDELTSALQEFARTRRIIPKIVPSIRAIGDFIAIAPHQNLPDLQTLANDCVTSFDGFRAPLTTEDRNRRNISALTERQIAHIERWGYPYVFDEFSFHMTLTGSVAGDRRTFIADELRKRFETLQLETIAIDHIGLLRQPDENSSFTIAAYLPLQS